MEFIARNYNQLAPQVYAALLNRGVRGPSRNGEVLRLPGVTTLVVTRPWERVNFDPFRDANPFFHLMESMAMLAPMNNVQFLAHFAKNMLNYSDDGKVQNAFYGTRIFETFGFDQLEEVIRTLIADPDSRQCVVQIWNPDDLKKTTKDKACNLMLIFSIDDKGYLCMTSFNRSNDAIWGILTGANVVHFSFFHEYVALALNRPMGPWTHVSNNLHTYTANPKWPVIATQAEHPDAYEGVIHHVPLWDTDMPPNGVPPHQELRLAIKKALTGMLWSIANHVTYCEHNTTFPFLSETVQHVFNTWQLHKAKFPAEIVLKEADKIQAFDWKIACVAWLSRRTHDSQTTK